jgi:hypothetical protein
MKEARLAAARRGLHGQQVMTFEQAASRIAGGFIRSIDDESLRNAIQIALPTTAIGELEGIKLLPGMVRAVAGTLRKVWRADISLSSRAQQHARLGAVSQIEAAVLNSLPDGMMRPSDIASAAIRRVGHARAILGPVEIDGLTELSPCWRPLLVALAAHVEVVWNAGPKSAPNWLEGTGVRVVNSAPCNPDIEAVSAATAYHESVEAIRWVRQLLASGVPAAQIAVAAASTGEFDDHLLALRSEGNIRLHFVHGVRILATRHGQAAAALADIVVRGLSQPRFRRLATLCGQWPMFKDLPEGWTRVLPSDAPLSTPEAWDMLLNRVNPEEWPDGDNPVPGLRAAIRQLAAGAGAAAEIGEAFLRGRALTIWRKVLLNGPATAIDTALEELRQHDESDACTSVAWMPASELAASPRHHVRLLGLNSSRWPRGFSEDRLIPDHVIPSRDLDPHPIHRADRCDFETILRTTPKKVVLSRARRDSEGRLLGRSPLLGQHDGERYLRRHAVPMHAFSETDRLTARPTEFEENVQAESAFACWMHWRRPEVTAHDGLVRENHPLIIRILNRTQSATSLRRLLRNPLGFVWNYAFGWRTPQSANEPLVLDGLATGDLFHRVFDHTLRDLESAGGLLSADRQAIEAAAGRAVVVVASDWEGQFPVPPRLVWERTLDEARRVAVLALGHRDETLQKACSYGEVPFGGAKRKSDAPLPWKADQPVAIPDTRFRIAGYIDRLDISADKRQAHVCDYKTGKALETGVLVHGGRELQRCLYTFVVRALLGSDMAISASLFYPLQGVELRLDDPETLLREITGHLRAGWDSLASGAALVGPDTGGDYDELAFALPANAHATYCKIKASASAARMGDATKIWEAQ